MKSVNLKGAGLILEGGGMRGVYTAGVLRLLMEYKLYLPYVIGVSIGACNAANYVSRQPERNKIVNIRYVNDSRFLSYLRLLFKGELFGMKFIFDDIPNRLVPFDFQRFIQNSQTCLTTVTDCSTGKAVYYEKKDLNKQYLHILQASVSLPFISKPVQFRGKILMDGGVSDSIPIKKSIRDGNTKHLIVLTQPKGYRKKRSYITRLSYIRYFKYKGLCRTLERRYRQYNETMEYIDDLEKQNKVFVIRPAVKLNARRVERNQKKLLAVYDQGYEDAEEQYPQLMKYLGCKVS